VNVLFVSPWLENTHVSPTFQLIRDQISESSRVVTRRALAEFLTPEETEDYSNVIGYAKRYPLSLGMLSIASFLERHGMRVAYVQLEAERERSPGNRDWLADAAGRVLDTYAPAVIGLGGVTTEIPRLRRAAALIREKAPHIPIVGGGPT
jgi:hypothetical protein